MEIKSPCTLYNDGLNPMSNAFATQSKVKSLQRITDVTLSEVCSWNWATCAEEKTSVSIFIFVELMKVGVRASKILTKFSGTICG